MKKLKLEFNIENDKVDVNREIIELNPIEILVLLQLEIYYIMKTYMKVDFKELENENTI